MRLVSYIECQIEPRQAERRIDGTENLGKRMEKIDVKYKMSSLLAREIHTQNISFGWEHLHNIEKYILLS